MADGGVFGGMARGAPEAPDPEELAAFELNDVGNAQRLIRHVGGHIDRDGRIDLTHARLLYLRQRGWIAFDGKRWDLDRGESAARRIAVEVVKDLPAQMAIRFENACSDADKAGKDEPGKKYKSGLYEWAEGCGNSGKLAGLLKVAEGFLEVDLEAFDADPLALNVQNGTLKFRKVDDGAGGWKAEVHFSPQHDPADRLTRIAGVKYDPKALAPRFDAFLQECQPLEHMRDCLQRLFGYAATGSQREQVFAVLQGLGRDGKSTLCLITRHVLGTYSIGCSVETFLDTGMKRGADASPDLARLAGDSRFVSLTEPPPNSKLNTGMVKKFTGGGTVEARELRQGIFEFEPKGKIVLECNRRPDINDTDDGIYRRLLFIPFRNQVPLDKIDPDLLDHLKAEGPGVLNWLVEGVKKWLVGRLTRPEEVRQAVEDYRRGGNPFAQWLADRVEFDPDAVILASDLYTDYKKWMEDNDHEKPWSQKTFGKALGDLQIILAGKDPTGKTRRKGAKLKDRPLSYVDRGLMEGFGSGAESDRQGAGGRSGGYDPAELPEDAPRDDVRVDREPGDDGEDYSA